MTTTFTENDLVRFIYNELEKNETAELKHALLKDTELQNQLEDLSATVNKLERVNYSAPNRAVNNILEYSKSFESESV